MWEIKLLDIITNKSFSKWFYNESLKNKFIKKVSYSKKLKVLATIDWR